MGGTHLGRWSGGAFARVRVMRSCAIAVGLMSMAGAALAETYHTAESGDDANPGTEAAPFRTIQHGASVLNPSDTLVVHSGTYAEEFYNGIPGGTSWPEPVTIAAAAGETVVIRPPPGAARVFTFASASVSYIIIDGFELDAVNVTHDAIKVTSGSTTGGSHHIRIQNCEVKNAPGQGILLTDSVAGVTDNEFINLIVHDNGTTDFDHGFYISTSNNLVENCTVYQNAGWGVHVYNGSEPSANTNTVRNNRVYDNGAAGDRSVGIGIYSGAGTIAYNNLVWGNKIGIALNYAASDPGVFHNTVYANETEGISLGSECTHARIQNNIVFDNGGSGIADQGTSTTLEANLLGDDPQFVDASTHDFHLMPGSPAIDQGIGVAEVLVDFDGNHRPQGAGYDIGAYELVTASGGAGGSSGAGGTGGSSGTGAWSGSEGTGGAQPATGGTAGTFSAPAYAEHDDDAPRSSGCFCRAGRYDRGGAGLASYALLAAVLVGRARRRL